MIDYQQFPGLAGVDLEDGYVTVIAEAAEQLVFQLDAVLTPESPAYRTPQPGEQYCYALGKLIFPDLQRTDWATRADGHYTDASGEQDLGNIDSLTAEGTTFILEGDWGTVRVVSDQPRFELQR